MQGTSAVVRGTVAGTRCVERVHVGVNAWGRAGEGRGGKTGGRAGYGIGRSVRACAADAREIGSAARVVGRGKDGMRCLP
jgi:hypothetical protein